MLVAIAKAAGKLDPPPWPQGRSRKGRRPDRRIPAAEFSVELAVSHTAIRLAQLHMPTRRAVAGDLLKKDRHKDPEKSASTGPTPIGSPRTSGQKRIQEQAVGALHQRRYAVGLGFALHDAPQASDNEVAAMQAQLPASLKKTNSTSASTPTRNAADLSTTLIDAWLNWVAKKHGVDLAGADIELATGTLRYYRHTVLWTRARRMDGNRQAAARIPDDRLCRHDTCRGQGIPLFFSTRDGSARPLPPGVSLRRLGPAAIADGVRRGGEKCIEGPGGARVLLEPPDEALLLSPRANLTTLARGRRDQLAQWLTPVLHDRFTQAREEARGSQTSLEGMTDFLLDFIPYHAAPRSWPLRRAISIKPSS